MKLIVNRIVSEFNKIFSGNKRVGDSLKLEGRRMSALDVANASTLGYKSESSLSVSKAVLSDKAVAIQSFSTNGNAVVDGQGNPVYIKEHQLSVANSQLLAGVTASNLEVDIARRLKVGSASDSPIINVSSLIVDPVAFRVKDSSLLGGKAEGDLSVMTAATATNALKVNNKTEGNLVVAKATLANKLISDDLGNPERYESQLNVNSSAYIRTGATFYTPFGLKEYILGLSAGSGDVVDAKKVIVDLAASSSTLTVSSAVSANNKASFAEIMVYLKDNANSEIYKATRFITGAGTGGDPYVARTGEEYRIWLWSHDGFATRVGQLNALTATRAVTFGSDTENYNLTTMKQLITGTVVTTAANSNKLENKTLDETCTYARGKFFESSSSNLSTNDINGFFGNTNIITAVKAIKVTSADKADALATNTTWAGSTSITNLGTITTGTWDANIIASNKIATALTGKTYEGLSISVSSNIGIITAGTSALSWSQSGSLGTAAFTASTAYATAGHVHGNITNDGKVGSTIGLPLVTGTGGLVTAGVWGSPVALAASAADGNATTFARSNHVHPFPTKSDISLGNVENTALSTWAGSSNLTTAGALTAASLSVTGNLIVNGTTTTINSTTVTIDDPIMTLGGNTAPVSDDSKDRGIEFRWHNGTSAKIGFFGFDDSTGKFTFIPDATNTSEVFSGTKGTLDAYVGWSDITSKPTTLGGYGITDAVSSNVAITAGTYKSVTVDAKGLVTAGTNPTTLTGYGISDAMSTSHAANSITGFGTVTALGTSSNGSATTVSRSDHVHQLPTLGGISDVTITANSSGEILKWNGSAWINNTLAEAGIQPTGSYGLTTGTLGQFAATTSLQLAGVISDETGTGSLVFANSPTLVTPNIGLATGTSFNSITGLSAAVGTTLGANAAVGTSSAAARADHVHPKQSMEEISNTSIASKANNDLLQWNGTNWINKTLAGAGIAPTSHAATDGTYGYGDATNAGHLRVGTGLSVTTGTVSVSYGSAANTSVQGNDARVTADQAAGTASIRTIGTTALAAAAGNHTHLYAGSASVGGPASSVAQSLTLRFDSGTNDGTSRYIFDGSTPRSIDIKAGSNMSIAKAAGVITISSTSSSAQIDNLETTIGNLNGSGSLNSVTGTNYINTTTAILATNGTSTGALRLLDTMVRKTSDLIGITYSAISANNTLSALQTSTTTSIVGAINELHINKVSNTTLGTWVGTTNITTVGTITSGTWNGAAIGNTYITQGSVTQHQAYLSITKSQISDFEETDYEPADATILKSATIGVTVQGYDSTTVKDGSYVHTDNNYTTDDKNKLAGIADNANNYTHPSTHDIGVIDGLQSALDGKVDDSQVLTNVPANAVFTDTVYNDTALAGRVSTLEGAGYITGYTVTQADVTAHQTALTIAQSQVTNLGTALSGKSDSTHKHDEFDRPTDVLTNGNVFSDIVVVDGIVTGVATRTLSATDIGLGNVLNKAITVTSTSVSDGTNTFNQLTETDINAMTIDADTVNSKTVLTNVPAGAVFTDTTYKVRTIHYNTFTGDGTTALFILNETTDISNNDDAKSNVKVFVDGIKVRHGHITFGYNTTNTTITLTNAPTNGTHIEVERVVIETL